MTKEKEIVIISGFMGFAIGVCVMMFVNSDKEARLIEKYNLELEDLTEEIYKYEGEYIYE